MGRAEKGRKENEKNNVTTDQVRKGFIGIYLCPSVFICGEKVLQVCSSYGR
jgi:hypothetical protein